MTAFNTFQRAKLAPIVVEMPIKTRQVPPALHGPNPEPTPDPSPQSTSPVELEHPVIVREKRRFAPQLVETSRRARRNGDSGPRTADQTDVTPYKRDKYKGRKQRQGGDEARPRYALSRTGSEDDCLLGRAARMAERQMQEAALAAFPNSRARAGGATHFYFRESDSDTSPESRSPPRTELLSRLRRRSSTDLGWWQKQHREHSGQLARENQGQDEIAMPRPIRPFAQLEQNCEADPELSVMRRAASPPMLGDDIVFRRCESPEPAKIHTDLPWTAAEEEEKCRDKSQKHGLWKGFCFKSGGGAGNDSTVKCGLWGPKMIHTPHPPATPHGGSFHAVGNNPMASMLSPPPTPGVDTLWRGGAPSPKPAATPTLSPFQASVCKPCPEIQATEVPVKKITKEELEQRIATEFDDAFVTKVYNYLSLGYPVSAQAYDNELSKITGMNNDEIRRDDARNLRKGHVCDDVVARTPERQQCPRWRALKAYIHEWARQHPDLDGEDPSPKAWGIKNRGGWGS